MNPVRYSLSDSAIVQEVAGESVIMDLRSEAYFGLNEAGTLIWRWLGEGLDTTAVLSRLQAHYGEPRSRLQGDLERVITDLAAAGLILPLED